MDAGLQCLADAFAGEGVGGARRLAGDDQAGPRQARAFERATQRCAFELVGLVAEPTAAFDQLAQRRVDLGEHGECVAQVQVAHGVAAVADFVAVRHADADVEHAVRARENPAVARRQARVPDHVEGADALDHGVVLDVAAQRDAARRAPLAHAGGDQRLRLRAGGQHHPAGAQVVHAAGCPEPRADDAAGLFDRRLESRRRQRPRAGGDRRAAQDVVKLAPWQHCQLAGHVDAPAARPDAADVSGTARGGHHFVEHAELAHGVVRIGNQAVAAHLVAREGVLVGQHHADSSLRQRARRRAAGGACADHQHVAGGGQRQAGGITWRRGRGSGGCRAVTAHRKNIVVGLRYWATGVRGERRSSLEFWTGAPGPKYGLGSPGSAAGGADTSFDAAAWRFDGPSLGVGAGEICLRARLFASQGNGVRPGR